MQIFTYKNANIFTFFTKIVYSSASSIVFIFRLSVRIKNVITSEEAVFF